MKHKTYRCVFITLVFILVLTCVSATAVYAYTDTDADAESSLDMTTVPAVTEQPEPVADPMELTPDGQMTLVDDVSGEQAEDKQFLTVITKNGNYFYIVIDRAGDTENVHFLNLVDESDLLALIEEEPTTTPAVTEPEPVTPAPIEDEPEPEQEPKSKLPQILGLILALALAGGGYFFYAKVLKPKQSGAKKSVPSDLDEFDFDDDEYDELPYAEDEPDVYDDDDYTDAEPEQYEFAVPTEEPKEDEE
jgi:hypothetical protein